MPNLKQDKTHTSMLFLFWFFGLHFRRCNNVICLQKRKVVVKEEADRQRAVDQCYLSFIDSEGGAGRWVAVVLMSQNVGVTLTGVSFPRLVY